MSDRSTPHISPMEGKGFCNRYAAVQAGGGALALPLLEQAARLIGVGPGDRPLIIADYGSSQGKNSLAPMRAAIAILRARTSPQRSILVYHIDLPANASARCLTCWRAIQTAMLWQIRMLFPVQLGGHSIGAFCRPTTLI